MKPQRDTEKRRNYDKQKRFKTSCLQSNAFLSGLQLVCSRNKASRKKAEVTEEERGKDVRPLLILENSVFSVVKFRLYAVN
jgi:hypothetical protein